MRRLLKFIRLQMPERMLLIEALACLGTAKIALWVLPFRLIAGRLGMLWTESPTDVDHDELEAASRVGWAVQTAARNVSWNCRCLEQGLAAKAMLRRRGVSSTLYLGVARRGGEPLEAHAWLRAGEIILTGGGGEDRYTVVSTFGEAG